jgi:hypothetical protein
VPAGTTPLPFDVVGSPDIQPVLGITTTPAIDTVRKVLYVVSSLETSATTTFQQYLYALDLKTGAPVLGSEASDARGCTA